MPAPLAPTTATTSPRWMVRLMPDRTVRLPRRAETSVRRRTTGVAGGVLADVVVRSVVPRLTAVWGDELCGVEAGASAW